MGLCVIAGFRWRQAWRSSISNTIVFWVLILLVATEAAIVIPSLEIRRKYLIDQLISEVSVLLSERIHAADRFSKLEIALPDEVSLITIFDQHANTRFSNTEAFNFGDLMRYTKRMGQQGSGHILMTQTVVTEDGPFYVVAQLNSYDVRSGMIEYAQNVAATVLVVISVLMIGTWIIVQRIVVQPLRKSIVAIQNKKNEERLVWKRNDEFGELFDSYNQMLESKQGAERRVAMKQNQLEYMAYHDALTNMPNRRAFFDSLMPVAPHTNLLVFVIGLDGFKMVNNHQGPEIGDTILAETGRRLATLDNQKRQTARLEGDEFAVLIQLTGDDEHNHVSLARDTLNVIEQGHSVKGRSVNVSASIGIAHSVGTNFSSEALFKNALIAMHDAKKSGGGSCVTFDDAMREKEERRLSLLYALGFALEKDEIFPVYQPKIRVADKAILGVECLSRWALDGDKMVPPSEFIPLAEESGTVVPIGEHVLRQALIDCRGWQEDNLADLKIAVNLSAIQLKDSTLPLKIDGLLRETGFRADQLELEITESAIMDNTRQAIDLMHAINSLGVQLSIDDFGTGYSSLAYLKMFPVQTLKIDQSFVRDLCDDENDDAIVSAVIGLAHQFGLNVVAEGVETEQQLELLATKSCDVAQGYYIGKPMPRDEFKSWASEWQRAHPNSPRQQTA
ncbi:MAG: EAL domain-containing protein [Pseudomonadota bacterium]